MDQEKDRYSAYELKQLELMEMDEELAMHHPGYVSIYYNPIEYLHEAFYQNKPIDEIRTQYITIDEAAKYQRIITDIYTNYDVIFNLNPREFEELIATFLRKDGLDVQLTKQTKDGGFDILCIHHIADLTPIKLLVECKRWTKNVDINIVRSFMNVIETENANKGMIVTTSYFTKGSIEKKNQKPYRLELKDKVDIINWVTKYK